MDSLENTFQKYEKKPYQDEIHAAADEFGVPREIALQLVSQESSFNAKARSKVGAIGLTQLMPDTAKELGVDPNDVSQNIRGGMKYLSQKAKKFGGNWKAAMAAYNGGDAQGEKVAKGQQPSYAETKGYVQKADKAILESIFNKYTNKGSDTTNKVSNESYASKYARIPEQQRQQLEKPIPEGFNTPDPSQKWYRQMADPLTWGKQLARTAEETGRAFGANEPGKYGKAGSLAFQSAMMIPSVAKVAMKPLGMAGGYLARKTGLTTLAGKAGETLAPMLKPIKDKITAKVGQLWYSSQTPLLEHNVMKDIHTFHADTQEALNEVGKIGEQLKAHNLGKDSLERVYNSMTQNPELEQSLTSSEKELRDAIAPLSKKYSDLAVKENIIHETRENYLTQMYESYSGKKGTQAQFLKNIMLKSPTSKERSFQFFTDLEKEQNEFTENILRPKGITREQYLKMSPGQLRLNKLPDKQFVMDLVPKRNPITALQAQILAVRKTLAAKKSVLGLLDHVDEQGDYMLEHEYRPGYTKVENRMLDKYVASRGTGRSTYFKPGGTYVKSELKPMLDKLLSSYSSRDEWSQALSNVSTVIKRVNFYNPFYHLNNLFSDGMQSFGANLKGVLGLPGKAIASDEARMSEAIKDGFQPLQLKRLTDQLKADFGQAQQGWASHVMPNFTASYNKFQDKMLWGYANNLGLSIWDSVKQDLIRKGISAEEAGMAGVTAAHDAIGKMTSVNSLRMFKNANLNRHLLFIPSWVNSSFRRWIGAFAPAQAFKHLEPATQQALAEHYRQDLTRGIGMGAMFYQRLNYAMTGHSTFENAPENQPSAYHPFGRIEITANGKRYAVDPFFKNMTLPLRMTKEMWDIGHHTGANPIGMGMFTPLAKAGSVMATGQDPSTGKPVDSRLGAAGQQLLPFAARRQDFGLNMDTAIRVLLPTSVSIQDPAKDGMSMMWKQFDEEHHYTIQNAVKPWHNTIDKLVGKDNPSPEDVKKATELAIANGESAHFVTMRELKHSRPVTYSFLMLKSMSKKDFGKYWSGLSPEQQESLQKTMRKEAGF